ncbi:unnamed protein product [Thelazia callipaeda]|uniref:Pecanex-like protein n=1 Tax=Thelazia callipaeda TaxID=103827 RepID=A0A0N5CW23_THECL|nr:unnamed protein product [Thelazia callipaeda]
MPSPSSPLEYRPTPHLILIIFFIIFPLIYFCARLAVATFFIIAFVFKSMFSPIFHWLYKDELALSMPLVARDSLVHSVNDNMQKIAIDLSSDEQLIDESYEEPERNSAVKFVHNSVIKSAVEDVIAVNSENSRLYNSEHSDNDDSSAISTASESSILRLKNPQNCNESELRHRNNTSQLCDV